jgi:hypothetical protein
MADDTAVGGLPDDDDSGHTTGPEEETDDAIFDPTEFCTSWCEHIEGCLHGEEAVEAIEGVSPKAKPSMLPS